MRFHYPSEKREIPKVTAGRDNGTLSDRIPQLRDVEGYDSGFGFSKGLTKPAEKSHSVCHRRLGRWNFNHSATISSIKVLEWRVGGTNKPRNRETTTAFLH